MKKLAVAALFLALPMFSQSASKTVADPWAGLAFLEGTWEAKTQGSSIAAIGTYTFQTELNQHIMARHGHLYDGCKGPVSFDCDHGDLLYLYTEAPGQPIKAIYFDNEGHVIHYDVTTPGAATAVFLSDGSMPGPKFRLTYELKDGVMLGKFQMQMPGQAGWKSYLEWSGTKK